ncbi:MAG TPA: helix-turn-helix transcriptional regulator [Solirubrobacteraceae bacterium]|nr:helix-turn-helix transcriptional regulator [Solirubrobacteraceae bacterium]
MFCLAEPACSRHSPRALTRAAVRSQPSTRRDRHASHGRLRVSDLTSELGCSRKHLAARFREHVGLPPKVYARMLRFRRATDLLSAGQSIAETAAECGYYDQPHLDRDFREFAGTTPSAYLAERVTFVQDATAADS